MRLIAKCTWIYLPLILVTAAQAADVDNWPGRRNKLGPPTILYAPGSTASNPLGNSCGDFARIPETSPKLSFYHGWVSGYISATNDARKYGGNVLGAGERKLADFLMMIREYCRENPMEPFINGVTVTVKKLQPVDWDGVSRPQNR